MAHQTSTARLFSRGLKSPVIVTLAALAALESLVAPAAANKAQPAYETAPRTAGEPVMAIVSIKSQNITFYDQDGWILRAPVSTGVKGRETPAGIFSIVQKNEDHRSNLYDDAHMPHMQRLTWNGIAMHGGPLPGYAASHGCVRMPFDFADRLFGKTRLGMRVIISPDDAAPEEFSHPALLVPDAKTVADAPERSKVLDREVEDAGKAAGEAKKAVKAAERDAAISKAALSKAQALKAKADADLKTAEKTLTAITKEKDQAKVRAEDRKLKAAARLAEAETRLIAAKADVEAKLQAVAAAKEASKAAASTVVDTANPGNAQEIKKAIAQAKKTADKAQNDAVRAKASLSKAQVAKAKADSELRTAEKALSALMKDQAKTRAEDRKLKAAAKAAEAGTRLDSAKADAAAKLEAVVKAKDSATAAAAKLADLTKVADEARLALKPVSVYISRAAKKIYVRRQTGKPWPDGGEVFDSSIEAPITIRDPDQPLGTHIFTAMANEDTGLLWTSVTIDSRDNAKNALDRITFPKDVLDRIAPSALPRSSIIISDEPLSRETNYRTEFVAVLSNQPQGGFKTRKPTVEVPIASYRSPSRSSSFFDFGYVDEEGPRPQRAGKPRRHDTRRKVQQDWFW